MLSVIYLTIIMSPAADLEAASELPALPAVARAMSEGLSLEALIEWADANNPRLREAARAVESARGRALQAGLYPNPVIAAGTNQLGGAQSQYVATLSQEIVVKGKLSLEQSAALRQVDQARFAFVRVRFEVLTAVREGYVRVLASQRRIEILAKLVDVINQSYQTANQLRKAGEGTETDVLLLEVELQRNQVALENAKTLVTAQARRLAAEIGVPEVELDQVAGRLDVPLPDFDMPQMQARLLQENARAQSARVEIDRRQILLRRASVEPYPNVTIEAGYQNSVAEPHDQAIVMVGVPIPVWNRNQGNIWAARAEIHQAQQALGAVQNELSADYAELIGEYQAAGQLVERLETKILPAARRALAITQQGYEQGQFDFLRLLEAQRSLVQTDLGYVDAQQARWLFACRLAGLLQLDRMTSDQ